jgi:hypothetical protein
MERRIHPIHSRQNCQSTLSIIEDLLEERKKDRQRQSRRVSFLSFFFLSSSYVCNFLLSPLFIEAGDEAEVLFRPTKPICVDAYDVCKPLGRMAAMDSNSLIMLGRVLEATKCVEE